MPNVFEEFNFCLAGGHITIWPEAHSSIPQGTFLAAADPQNHWYGYIFNNSNAQYDAIEYKADLAPGVYDLRVHTTKQETRAIITLKVDGVVVSTFDAYAVGLQWNQIWNEVGIIVEKGGLKTLQFIVESRNPLSTDWYFTLSWISLWRTFG